MKTSSTTCKFLFFYSTLLVSTAVAWNNPHQLSRKALLEGFTPAVLAWGISQTALAADSNFQSILSQVQKARSQLDPVPKLIEAGKWDSVRAILIEPPLVDCWGKTNRALLSKYAEALGDVGGDEFEALEIREDLVSHLRYLDMAVYNNNFNPIATEGTTGATKELIRSFYEDPINEFKASVKGFDALINLASGLQ